MFGILIVAVAMLPILASAAAIPIPANEPRQLGGLP